MKRMGSALAMGLVGGMIGATTGGLATFYVYGIGMMVGLPAGFFAGALYGWRVPARDAAIIIAMAAAILAGVGVYGARNGMDSFWTTVIALASASIVSLVLALALPKLVPAQVRYVLAIPLSILFVGGLFGAWVWRIYQA